MCQRKSLWFPFSTLVDLSGLFPASVSPQFSGPILSAPPETQQPVIWPGGPKEPCYEKARNMLCYLGGKSLDIFGKMPLYTLSHPLLTLRFLHLTVGILQSSPCLPFILKSKKIFLLVLLRLLNCFGEWIFSWSEVSFQKQHPHHCVCSPPEERFDSSLKRS